MQEILPPEVIEVIAASVHHACLHLSKNVKPIVWEHLSDVERDHQREETSKVILEGLDAVGVHALFCTYAKANGWVRSYYYNSFTKEDHRLSSFENLSSIEEAEFHFRVAMARGMYDVIKNSIVRQGQNIP